MKQKLKHLVLGTVSSTIVAMSLSAGAQNEDAIKYRQSTMSALGGHMASLSAIVRSKVDHSSHAGVHASGIAALAPLVVDVFPSDSELGETKALSAVWEQPDEFAERVRALETAAETLGAAGDDLQAIGAALGEVGRACKGCHDDFRE
jgi:cytochrome c556